MADNLSDKLFPQQCGCNDCEAAVSPAAYLAALLDYTLKHVRNNNIKFDLKFLDDTFHQPFSQLPTDCEAVGKQVRQVRICIEVLRSYLGKRPLADPAKELALTNAEGDYRFAVYSLLLSSLGTSYEEIRRIHKELPEIRQALADRLGIDLTSPRPTDPPGDELDQLFLDAKATDPKPITEQLLEILFGLADTNRDPLSEATKLGDDSAQITRWDLNGAEWGQNTAQNGMVYVSLVNPAANVYRVELYQDQLRKKLVGSGQIATTTGTVKLVAENNSRLSGAVEIAYSTGSSTISIAAIPIFLSWQLKHLRTIWFQQDYPIDAYSDGATQKLPLIDPDLIGPDDFRRPTPKSNAADPDRAFDLWLQRRQAVDKIFQDLKTNREKNGLDSTLQQVFGNPLPDLDGLLFILTKGTTEDVKVAKDSVLTLGLTVESFTQLMTLRAKDQLVKKDIHNEPVSDAECMDIYSILTQVTKTKQFGVWGTEEQSIKLLLGTQDFWFSLSEPKEGDWPPLSTSPYIDPSIIKLSDLPDATVGKAAIKLWNERKKLLENIPIQLKEEREKKDFNAMLSLALKLPDPSTYLETLKTKLASPVQATQDEATKLITDDLLMSVDNFKRLLVIRANNNPTAAEFSEVYTLLTPTYKVKNLYEDWKTQEKPESTFYWSYLKAKVPRWRAQLEARVAWQQALRVRSQRPVIDPTVMGADDLQNITPGYPAFDIWQARYAANTSLVAGLKKTPDATKINGLDTIIKETVELEPKDIEALTLELKGGQNMDMRLAQFNLTYGAFTYLLRIRGLAKAGETITDSEWDTVCETLAESKTQRDYAALRKEESDNNIILSQDFFKIAKTLLTPLPFLNPTNPIWLSTWQVRQDWQDTLQTRIDQQSSAIDALLNAISTVEEALLTTLRDALVLSSDAAGYNLDEKAGWITDQLLIDAKTGGCQITTRVEQAIETLQQLMFKLRLGQILERHDWLTLVNSDKVRIGSAVYSSPLTLGGGDDVLAVVGEDNRIYSIFASQMLAGPWTHVGVATDHKIPADTNPSLFSIATQDEASLFATGFDGQINFISSLSGNDWSLWAPIGAIQVRTSARISVAEAVQEKILHAFVVQNDGLVFGNWRDNQWHDWSQIGNDAFKVPLEANIAAASLKGEVQLFVAGNDGKIYRSKVMRNLVNDWTPIDAAGQVTFLSGAAISVIGSNTGDASIELIAVGEDGGIYHTSWNEMTDAWLAWSREGKLTVTLGSVVTIAGGVGDIRLFTVSNDGRVYARAALDWEPIGDTRNRVGLPIASRVDDTGAIHLYLVKGNQVLTTSQSVLGAPWKLSSFSLTLVAEWFDEEWKWIGSYAPWRSAMFVTLYVENILQPSLLKPQTQKFQELINNTRGIRLSPEKACQLADIYADYFRDICSLEVEATCQASTVIYTGEGCERQKGEAKSMFYMFGRATSGKVYWSAYDPNGNSSGNGQTLWEEVSVFTDTKSKVVRIIGAMPYRKRVTRKKKSVHERTSFEVLSSYIHLFCLTSDGDKKALKLARLNLDNFGEWDDHDLDMPPLSNFNLEIIPVQTQNEFIQPALVFHTHGVDKFYYRTLNSDGTGWNESGDWSSFLNIINLGAYDSRDSSGWDEIKAVLSVNGSIWLITVEPLGGGLLAQQLTLVPGGGQTIKWGQILTLGIGNFLGVLPGPEQDLSINPNGTFYIFIHDESSNTSKYHLVPWKISPLIHDALADLIQIPPHSGSASSGQQMLAYKQNKNAQAYYMYKFAEANDKLVGSVTLRAVPRVQAPLNIPLHLSETDLQKRRQDIINAFALNDDATASVRHYLQEAYYFVPLHLALALQSAGNYLASLDCFRTFYDYEAQVGTPNQRNIYYGLELDAKLPDVTTYQQADNWLLDPLDPHFIAATRRYAYTRFTIISLVRCILDYADSEFSQETGEGQATARTLYLIAIELLNLPELQQKLGKCDDLIAELKIEPGKEIPPEVPAAVGEIMDQLTKGIYIDLSAVVLEVNAKLKETTGWATKLAEAKTIVQQANAIGPLPHSLGALMSEKAVLIKEKHTFLLAQPKLDEILKKISNVALGGISGGIGQPQPSAQPSSNKSVAPFMTPSLQFCIPPNPILKALHLHAELNLYKLRTCRNIAGMKRQLDPYAAPTDTTTGLPTIGANGQLNLPGTSVIRPTIYRYPVLIERAKQMVQIAGQIEAAMLAALVQRDNEAFHLQDARQQLKMAQAGVQLQTLKIVEANSSVKLAELQKDRAQIQLQKYQELIASGLNQYEQAMILNYKDLQDAQLQLDTIDTMAKIYEGFTTAAAGGATGAAAAMTFATQQAIILAFRSQQSFNAVKSQTAAQTNSIYASFERRKEEWELQSSVAAQDMSIGDQQITVANNQVNVVTQDKVIAELTASNAKDTIQFLTTKFTNVNLYDWMIGILEGVYRFFLQQATVMAKLSENQLAFLRQEVPAGIIKSDYWQAPSASDLIGSNNANGQDLHGLTGSARLLQDIYQLDQYAFDTDKRKLQLTKTFSLAQLAPLEFQQFRETGVMIFSTPIELFDRGFPGHYLRLIKRVRTSVIALIPPIQGIYATLTSSGLTRTVIGPEIFQTVTIHRDPEFVALTSPVNSTGMFELDSQQTDMLLPFEGNGVDGTFEFRMPKAANQFDYRTLADILITYEYTALNSFDYRQQVVQTLNHKLSSDRPFSFRNQFPDQWYDLSNPEQSKTPMTVQFQTYREDFPPNIETLKIQHILLYFVSANPIAIELPITQLRFKENGNLGSIGGSVTPIDGIISTRKGNASSWTSMIGKSPIGEWELTLPNTDEIKKHFQNEELDDILFVITYAGRIPEWPS